MECVDILHCVWIGVAQDATGSLLMDLAEHCPDFACETWDESLQLVTLDAREWCRRHKFPPSTVDDFSSFVGFGSTFDILLLKPLVVTMLHRLPV